MNPGAERRLPISQRVSTSNLKLAAVKPNQPDKKSTEVVLAGVKQLFNKFRSKHSHLMHKSSGTGETSTPEKI